MNLREECQPWEFGFNTLPGNRLGRSMHPTGGCGFRGLIWNERWMHEMHQAVRANAEGSRWSVSCTLLRYFGRNSLPFGAKIGVQTTDLHPRFFNRLSLGACGEAEPRGNHSPCRQKSLGFGTHVEYPNSSRSLLSIRWCALRSAVWGSVLRTSQICCPIGTRALSYLSDLGNRQEK